MERFKIKDESEIKPDLSNAMKLLEPYYHLAPESKYPINLTIENRKDVKDRSYFDPNMGHIHLKYAKEQSPEDMQWVLIHEMGHFFANYNNQLKRATELYENLALKVLFKKICHLTTEEVREIFHDFFPSEVYANAFATMLTGKYFKRHPFKLADEQLKKIGVDIKKSKDKDDKVEYILARSTELNFAMENKMDLVRKLIKEEVSNLFAEQSTSAFEQLVQLVKTHDWYYNYSDDHSKYSNGQSEENEMRKLWSQLPLEQQTRIYDIYKAVFKNVIDKKDDIWGIGPHDFPKFSRYIGPLPGIPKKQEEILKRAVAGYILEVIHAVKNTRKN